MTRIGIAVNGEELAAGIVAIPYSAAARQFRGGDLGNLRFVN